jgi:competence protein ComEC
LDSIHWLYVEVMVPVERLQTIMVTLVLAILAGCTGPVDMIPDGQPIKPWDIVGDSGAVDFRTAVDVEIFEDADLEVEVVPDPVYEPPDGFEVVFLDVGQGDSILVRFPLGTTMLVDGGNKSAGWKVILPYFDDLHMEFLDFLVVTHPDADHCGGLDDVVWGVVVGEVWENGQVANTYAWWDFSDAVDDLGVPRRTMERGKHMIIDGCDVDVLNADQGWGTGDVNGNSIVLAVECEDVRVLLTGDAHAGTQADLMDVYGDHLHSDVVKVPHHGSADRDSGFPAAVQASAAVCSVGATNGYGHPDLMVIEEWEDSGADFYRTDEMGTVIMAAQNGVFDFTTEY